MQVGVQDGRNGRGGAEKKQQSRKEIERERKKRGGRKRHRQHLEAQHRGRKTTSEQKPAHGGHTATQRHFKWSLFQQTE